VNHILKICGRKPYKTHKIKLYNIKGTSYFSYKSDRAMPKVHALVVLVRDYRECIIRQIYRDDEAITNEMIDLMMDRKHKEPAYDVYSYFQNLRVYDTLMSPKVLVYYEDLMTYGLEGFKPIADLLDLNISLLNWDREFQESLRRYTAPKMSGGKLKFHQHKIEDIDYYNKKVLGIDPEMVDRYLKRYL
jgi:hypothetical protein